MLRVALSGALLSALGALGRPTEASALSTVVARFHPDAVVSGSGMQVARLWLHYYPGDGEAIVRSVIDFDPQQLKVTGVEAAVGQVAVVEGSVRLSYAAHPLGAEATDTLDISLVTGSSGPGLSWQVRAFSSLDGEVAHATAVELGIEPPLEVEVSCLPDGLYPGEEATLEAVIRNRDARGRELAEVSWQWPDAVSPIPDQTPTWGEPLLPGDRRSLLYGVRVRTDAAPGEVRLTGIGRTDRIAASPLPEMPLEILGGVQLQVDWQANLQEAEHPGVLVCNWRNPGIEPVDLAALRVAAPHAIPDLQVDAGSLDVAVASDGRQIDLTGPVSLGPGESVSATLRFTPERPGAFQWRGWFQPAGHRELIPAAGDTRVEVVLAPGDENGPGEGEPQLTDVEMVCAALRESLGQALAELPLGDGARVELVADASGKTNWMVADALTHALFAQGHRPVLGGSGQSDNVLHYRLVEAKVVYTPRRGGWNPFRDGYRREVHGDVLLKLEPADARSMTWARVVTIRGADEVASEASEWLGSAKTVDRIEVDPDYRAVEMSLSGLIVGGLFFVFFVP